MAEESKDMTEKDFAEHVKAEGQNWVKMVKDGQEIDVHKSCVASHESVGWTIK